MGGSSKTGNVLKLFIGNMGTSKGLKIYTIIISLMLAAFAAGFFVLFFKGNYDRKLLAKLGIKTQQTTDTNWAVVGWNNTMEKLDYDADIVFFGDSITRGSDFREYFPGKKIVNLGFSGDTLSGMKKRITAVKAVTPEKVFVLGGINGLTDINSESTLKTYGELLDALRENLPEAEIYVQSIMPVTKDMQVKYCHNTTIEKFNTSLEQLAAQKGMTFIDLYSQYVLNGELNSEYSKDGVHIKPEAYAVWAEVIKPYVNDTDA